MFCKKGILKDFTKFTGKHLCQILFSHKLAGEICNPINKENLIQVFSCEFCENTFFTEHLWETTSALPTGYCSK